VIDVDAEEEESRYDIPRKKRRISKDEVIVIGSDSEERGGQVKINRKRAFWASKGGTAPAAAAGLGTGSASVA
jgi:hypothetical protein